VKRRSARVHWCAWFRQTLKWIIGSRMVVRIDTSTEDGVVQRVQELSRCVPDVKSRSRGVDAMLVFVVMDSGHESCIQVMLQPLPLLPSLLPASPGLQDGKHNALRLFGTLSCCIVQ
jgi:hypothetical protein